MTLDTNPIIEREVWIAASPETVFSFFTDPVKLVRWKGIKATLDPQPGGIYRLDINGQDIASGYFVEVIPHQRIVFTWGWEGKNSPLPPGASTVEVTLMPDGPYTIVRLKHAGLDKHQNQHQAEGWDYFLPRLVIAVAGVNVDASVR